ncbi:hypothetical protein LOAG_06695 [Loa loa]|uniref:WH2 domain-containing protein n=1 Tax=Loa loa TaxID=7209 RepID=A0A1I7V8A8_LOALO|nr:hypothetical protein LOAG_06695 [Loa loa]EFO21792.2 hypothetical protein LOAG_06695 [Loa loa]
MMIRTIPPRLPTTPPPPPPPPSGIQVKPKNGSSSRGTKWTLRTEARDGGNRNSVTLRAEGVIEIPKPQSVASLREQIARKLEVKMPSTPPPPSGAMTMSNGRTRSSLWVSDSNGQCSYVPQHDDPSNLQHLTMKTSKPSNNPQPSNYRAPQKQLSVVHEPVERHTSCITPVSFNRTVTLSSSVVVSPNMLNIGSNSTSVVPTSSSSDAFSPSAIIHKHEENNDYTCSSADDMAGSSQLNDYQKLKPVKQRVDDRPQSSLPSKTSSIVNDSFRRSTVSENAITVPQIQNPLPFVINGHNTDRNEMAIRNLEIPPSIKCCIDDIVPAKNFRTDIVQKVGSQFSASSSSIVAASTPPCEILSFWKPIELRTKMQSKSGHLHQLQSEQNQGANDILKTCNSHLSAPERELNSTSGTIPRHDAHTENSSWYRTMFKKMHVVNQLGKLLHDYLQS